MRNLCNMTAWRTIPWLAAALIAAWSPGRSCADADAAGDDSAEIAQQIAELETRSVDAAQVAEWIEDLDAQRFNHRQRAEANLQAAGPAALAAVSAAARDAALERSTRAVRILLVWSESGAPDERIAALQELAKATETHPTEAAFAHEQFAAVREAAALETLAAHGAVHNFDQFAPATHRYAPLQIMIGPRWTGGDEALAALADVRRLRTLSFHRAPVTNEGLRYAAKIGSLDRLELYGTPSSGGVSPEVLSEIRTALPELADIEIRPGGAQLGIQGDSAPARNVAYVYAVFPNTAAARAGIQRGDIITDVEGTQVTDFKSLTAEIAKYQPGDSVTMTIQRNGQELKLPVTFDGWGDNETLTEASMRGATPRIIINGGQRIVIPAPQPAPQPQPQQQPQQPAPAQPKQQAR